MKPLITVFTPTYNRAHLLERLYNSLCEQTSSNFQWLVIDDGSSDNTCSLLSSWKDANKITMKWYHVSNGGKHRAINQGVGYADTELFFIVDSDDFLVPTAIEEIVQLWTQRPTTTPWAGLCFRRATPQGTMLGNPFPTDLVGATMFDLTYLHKANVDRAEVFLTYILRQYPFDEIPGETFLTEALVWNRMSQDGHQLLCSNSCIYICDYQPIGLTSSFQKLLRKNPIGMQRYYAELLRTPKFWAYPCPAAKALIRWMQTIYYRWTKR